MTIVRVLVSADGQQRVNIFRRNDGSFGFEEERYSSNELEHCWIPTGRPFASFCDSEQTAVNEASGRIPWLGDEVDVA